MLFQPFDLSLKSLFRCIPEHAEHPHAELIANRFPAVELPASERRMVHIMFHHLLLERKNRRCLRRKSGTVIVKEHAVHPRNPVGNDCGSLRFRGLFRIPVKNPERQLSAERGTKRQNSISFPSLLQFIIKRQKRDQSRPFRLSNGKSMCHKSLYSEFFGKRPVLFQTKTEQGTHRRFVELQSPQIVIIQISGIRTNRWKLQIRLLQLCFQRLRGIRIKHNHDIPPPPDNRTASGSKPESRNFSGRHSKLDPLRRKRPESCKIPIQFCKKNIGFFRRFAEEFRLICSE